MKTTLDKVESYSYGCFQSFTTNTVIGAGIATVLSFMLLKSRVPAILYGAGIGGGYSLYRCDEAFQSLETSKQEYPAESYKWQEALLMLGKVLNDN